MYPEKKNERIARELKEKKRRRRWKSKRNYQVTQMPWMCALQTPASCCFSDPLEPVSVLKHTTKQRSQPVNALQTKHKAVRTVELLEFLKRACGEASVGKCSKSVS
jgi:hypothetical protein